VGLQESLLLAAEAIEDRRQGDLIHPQTLALLEALECPFGVQPAESSSNRAALFRSAAQFRRLFRLRCDEAPGLVAFGTEAEQGESFGEASLISACGAGLNSFEAFSACVGEGVERLSQVEAADDRAASVDLDGASSLDHAVRPETARVAVDYLEMRRLQNNAPYLVPVDLCLRRPPARRRFEAPWPLSIGCAAGVSAKGATLHALLELIERDSAALWWRGGRRGRPLAPSVLAEAETLVKHLRGNRSTRQTWFLDISSEFGVPVVAAMSSEPDGKGFCCGMAARLGFGAAARSALIEMCQSELSHQVIQIKRATRGDAALNARDDAHLRRFMSIDARSCLALHPAGTPSTMPQFDTTTTEGALEATIDRLERMGFEPLVSDLTRARFNIPVMRVLCPGLEQEPSRISGERLRHAFESTGGGPGLRTGVSLV
jgi:ribosomal protein S12 methylthiotransferase accessory factor